MSAPAIEPPVTAAAPPATEVSVPVPPPLPAAVRRLPVVEARERLAALLDDPAPPVGPSVEPCVCGAPRWAHTGRARTGRCADTGCARYRRDLVDALVERALTGRAASFGDDLKRFETAQRAKRVRRAEGTLGIGPSDTANCPKAIEFRERPPEDFVRAPEDKRPARIGAMIHRDWITVDRALYPWRLHEYPVPIPGLDSPNIKVDRYDPITGDVDDAKTAGDWMWNHVGVDGPDEEVWEQVLLYAYGLATLGFPVRRVRLIYIKRDNGHDEVFTRPYDEAAALKALNRLLGYAMTLDAGGSLPRSRSGPSTDPICRGCFARVTCWNMTRAEALGRSPESLTVLGEDIDPAEVEWTLVSYDEARGRESVGKADKAKAKALLDGVPLGQYGEWYLGETAGGRKVDHKGRVEQLEAYYDLPDGERPPLTDLLYPKTATAGSISVNRQRKAKRDAEAAERGVA